MDNNPHEWPEHIRKQIKSFREEQARADGVAAKFDELMKEALGGRIPDLWDRCRALALPTALFAILVAKGVLAAGDETMWKELVEEHTKVIYDQQLEITKEFLRKAGLNEEEIEETLRNQSSACPSR
jgi:hypothetical protein